MAESIRNMALVLVGVVGGFRRMGTKSCSSNQATYVGKDCREGLSCCVT